MKQNENIYVNLGFQYQNAATDSRARALAMEIRRLVESEEIEDRAEARRLIETGRNEAR